MHPRDLCCNFNALLAGGANTELCDNDSNVPLLAATAGGHIEVVVRALLEAGANPNHSCRDGKSALQIAMQCLNIQLTLLLLEWKAVITAEGLAEVFAHHNVTIEQVLAIFANHAGGS